MRRVLLEGRRIDGLRPEALAQRGVLRTFQLTRAFPRMSVLDNYFVPFSFFRASARQRPGQFWTGPGTPTRWPLSPNCRRQAVAMPNGLHLRL